MFVCQTCKGTALILAVEGDGRLCFEECPDCNAHPEIPYADFWKTLKKGTSAQTLALILFDEKNDDNLFVDR
jgi:hypothetical protein